MAALTIAQKTIGRAVSGSAPDIATTKRAPRQPSVAHALSSYSLNFEKNFGDAFIQQLIDITNETEFSDLSKDRRQQLGSQPYTLISNTPIRQKPKDQFKGIIIQQHSKGKTEKGLLTSIAKHGGKRTPCTDDWQTGRVLGWEKEFLKPHGIQCHSNDLRGKPKEEFRQILRMILS